VGSNSQSLGRQWSVLPLSQIPLLTSQAYNKCRVFKYKPGVGMGPVDGDCLVLQGYQVWTYKQHMWHTDTASMKHSTIHCHENGVYKVMLIILKYNAMVDEILYFMKIHNNNFTSNGVSLDQNASQILKLEWWPHTSILMLSKWTKVKCKIQKSGISSSELSNLIYVLSFWCFTYFCSFMAVIIKFMRKYNISINNNN